MILLTNATLIYSIKLKKHTLQLRIHVLLETSPHFLFQLPKLPQLNTTSVSGLDMGEQGACRERIR